MAVSAALFNQIACQLVLCQEGIGADGLSTNLDSRKKRNSRLDFIGFFLSCHLLPQAGNPLFLGGALGALLTHHAHDVGRTICGIQGVTQGLSIDGQTLVLDAILCIPAL
jgi:hypothetical protein